MSDTLSADTVRLAYQLFLGRTPENDGVVNAALSAYPTIGALRAAFLTSPEFLGHLGRTTTVARPPPNPALVGIDAPPIDVEWETNEATATAMLAHVQATWTQLGRDRPHWSVLSANQFLPEHIAKTEAAFFDSGAGDTANLLAVLRRAGMEPGRVAQVFEFGCGLGRVTGHLAKVFSHVAVCDVSASHMDSARRRIASLGLRNVSFTLADATHFGMTGPFDLWFSRIVLQHNPPPIIAMILRRALSLLTPGGMAVFQVPTYALGYRFAIRDYLQGLDGSREIEMHVLPQPVVFRIAHEAGCEPLEVLEDMSAGPSSGWNSTTFVLRKGAV